MESKSLFRTFGIILFSAIVNTLCFIAILGLPMPQIFSSSRDPEAVLQNLKQKEITEPVNPQPLTLNDIPAPTPKRTRVKPKHWKTAHVKPVVKPTAKKLDVPPAEPRSDEETTTADKPSEHQPKVVDVNFDNKKPDETKPAEAKAEDAKPDEVKAEDAKPEEAAQEAPKENSQSPEQVKREEMDESAQQPATADSDKDDKDKLTPVKDRIAGVQAAKDDSETEANSPDANPPQPDEIQPAAVLDSTDGQ